MSDSDGSARGGVPQPEHYNSPTYADSVLRRLASLRSRGLSPDQIAARIALTHAERPGGGEWSPAVVRQMIKIVDESANSGEPARPSAGTDRRTVAPERSEVAPVVSSVPDRPTEIASAPPPLPKAPVGPVVAASAYTTDPRFERPADGYGHESQADYYGYETHDDDSAYYYDNVYEPKRGRTAGRLLLFVCALLALGLVGGVAWSQGLLPSTPAQLSSAQDAADGEMTTTTQATTTESSGLSLDLDDDIEVAVPPVEESDGEDGDMMIIRIEPSADGADGAPVPATATIRNDGKLHVEGAFPTPSEAQSFLRRAGEVFGSENIVEAFVIDPQAATPTVSDVALDKPVLFKSGSAEIDPSYIAFLEACGDVLKLNPSIVMSISAYTDSQGSEEFNLELSQARANAIVDFYRTLEIDDSQLVGVGLGEEDAFGDNSSEAGREQNRRAMLQLMNIMDEG